MLQAHEYLPASEASKWQSCGRQCGSSEPYFCAGGTYSLGTAEPSPKKNISSCLTMAS